MQAHCYLSLFVILFVATLFIEALNGFPICLVCASACNESSSQEEDAWLNCNLLVGVILASNNGKWFHCFGMKKNFACVEAAFCRDLLLCEEMNTVFVELVS
jgi:hypothetical protein